MGFAEGKNVTGLKGLYIGEELGIMWNRILKLSFNYIFFLNSEQKTEMVYKNVFQKKKKNPVISSI